MRVQPASFLIALLLGCASLAAQSADFFPLEEVRPGLTGVGRTIFKGVDIEEFQVEILGVIRNIAPRQDMILAKLSGEKIEKTGVFAGMSGSPVYIDGKMVGAVAYAFPFSKEPIAGLTPIGEMVNIFKQRPVSGRTVAAGWKRPVSDLLDMANAEEIALPESLLPQLAATASGWESFGSLIPIATPISLGGLSRTTLSPFAEGFRDLGLTPVRGLATVSSDDYPDTPVAPGSTVTVQMVRGDMDVSASGTVTHVSGNQVYAFGHPFMGTGYTDMPMARGAVLTVISSVQNSEKVTATLNPIGALRQDRATGIMGQTGARAQLLPVKLSLMTSRN